MFDPDKVKVVMDELCEEMCIKDLCIETNDNCKRCPLNATESETVDRIEDFLNEEL